MSIKKYILVSVALISAQVFSSSTFAAEVEIKVSEELKIINSDIGLLQAQLKKATIELELEEKRQKAKELRDGPVTPKVNPLLGAAIPGLHGSALLAPGPIPIITSAQQRSGQPSVLITAIEGYGDNIFAIATYNGRSYFKINQGDKIEDGWTATSIQPSGTVVFERKNKKGRPSRSFVTIGMPSSQGGDDSLSSIFSTLPQPNPNMAGFGR
jgi:type IV pilus biogenesis protein PilP